MGLESSSLAGVLSSIQSTINGVESFVLHEAVSQVFALYVNALSLDARVELKQMYSRPVTLHTTLANGSRTRRSGYLMRLGSLGADGGFARKGLLVQPWIAILGETPSSRIWQEKSIIEIVEDVFADHTLISAWRWGDDVASYVANGMFARNGGQRSYCFQYRESDLDFVSRLLVEESLCYRIEENESAQGWHTMVFLVNSANQHQDQTRPDQTRPAPGRQQPRGAIQHPGHGSDPSTGVHGDIGARLGLRGQRFRSNHLLLV
jgi:type VI secretion system secreted protein VgrG